jgi:predicted ATPase
MSRPEMAVGRRITALTCFLQGAFEEAQINAEEALKIYDPEWDSEIKFRTNHDTGATATAYMALTSWMFGNISQAQKFADEAKSRALVVNHVPTIATTSFFIVLFDAISGRAERTGTDAAALIQITREHATPLFLSLATIFQGWAATRLGDRDAGRTNLSEGLANYTGQGNRTFLPLIWGLLAHIEAEDGGTQAALIRVDEALVLAAETGERWSDSFLHQIRGEILLRGDPANMGPAEDAFLNAIAIAQQQKAKSFELRAAFALAKVYQSTGQLADAHCVLAPAVQGFSPTVEFPEVAEAQALLVTTAEAEKVKRAAASRHRRLKLQTNFGRAMMWSKGYAAQETKVAFARARELCADITDPAERFPTYYGLWVGSLMRGELASARETANIFLGDAESGAWLSEAAAASRVLGQRCLWQGDFDEAQIDFEKAFKIYDPERDREVKFRFGMDTMAGSKALLAVVKWLFGDTGRARELIESALALAAEFDHVGTLAPITYHRAELEILRGDAGLALHFANTLLELSRERGMPLFSALGAACRGWANAKLGEVENGMAELRDGLTAFSEQGNKTYVPFLKVLLAEIEAKGRDSERALARIAEALTLVAETGEHWTDSLLHRIRGEILLKRDPANTAPSEEAFLTAIAIAQQQKAKSFELQAALAVAKLYQSSGRAADAQAALAISLEGFSPTPELPEIREAQTLLAALI